MASETDDQVQRLIDQCMEFKTDKSLAALITHVSALDAIDRAQQLQRPIL